MFAAPRRSIVEVGIFLGIDSTIEPDWVVDLIQEGYITIPEPFELDPEGKYYVFKDHNKTLKFTPEEVVSGACVLKSFNGFTPVYPGDYILRSNEGRIMRLSPEVFSGIYDILSSNWIN